MDCPHVNLILSARPHKCFNLVFNRIKLSHFYVVRRRFVGGATGGALACLGGLVLASGARFGALFACQYNAQTGQEGRCLFGPVVWLAAYLLLLLLVS